MRRCSFNGAARIDRHACGGGSLVPSLSLQAQHQFYFFRKSKKMLAIWLACGIGAIALVWIGTTARIQQDYAEASEHAQRDIESLLKSNAAQIARTIDYIDHLTLLLSFQWHETGSLNLEKQILKGYFPLTAHFYATLVDQEGNLVSTTLGSERYINVSSAEYFQFHKASPETDLRISKPSVSSQLGLPVVHFTRRLTNADGGFGGVIIVAVRTNYFETFEEQASLGPDDCMSVRYIGGAKLAARLGKNVEGINNLFRSTPAFDLPNAFVQMQASDFVDGKARTVAWHRAAQYPIVAAIALEESHLYAIHHHHASEFRSAALAVSALIVVLSVGGAYLAAWLSWKRAQAEEIKQTYRLATDNAQEGFIMLRALFSNDDSITDFLVEDCNGRGAMLVGFRSEAMIGKRFSDLYTGRSFVHLLGVFSRAMKDGFYEDEFNSGRRKEPTRWLHRRLVRAGESTLAMTVRDITESKTYELRLADMANFDALTGLHNRYWLNGYLPNAIDAANGSGCKLALLFIDLDKFKAINDTMGHAFGDRLLAAAARRIASLLRPGDEAVRIGGDEFTIVLKDVEAREDALHVTNRIVSAMREPFAIDGNVVHVTASVGASFYPDDGADAETLLKNADIAMYCAKDEQRNGNIKVFRPEMYRRITDRANAEREIAEAIRKNELILHYQPKVDTMTAEPKGFEALVRWVHPQRGLVPPVEFIPMAESSGFIAEMGEMVIEMACAQLVQWRNRGFLLLPVSVNVSAQQFHNGRVDQVIAATLHKYRLSPSLLEVEITESAMLGDADAVVAQVAAIRQSGVQVHIDDFGTGYSSLSMLHRLEMDVLKIDRAFTKDLGTGKSGEALFEAIVSIAKSLDMRIVAEGVETEEQRETLQALCVDEMQGYLISKPLSARDAELFLKKEALQVERNVAA